MEKPGAALLTQVGGAEQLSIGGDANGIEKKLVYVAAAYAGDIEGNTRKTQGYSKYVIEQGAVPVNPILNFHGVLFDETDRDLALALDMLVLERCDELWAFGEPTAGMRMELERAKEKNIPIKYITPGGNT